MQTTIPDQYFDGRTYDLIGRVAGFGMCRDEDLPDPERFVGQWFDDGVELINAAHDFKSAGFEVTLADQAHFKVRFPQDREAV